jgi:hypothetical protein
LTAIELRNLVIILRNLAIILRNLVIELHEMAKKGSPGRILIAIYAPAVFLSFHVFLATKEYFIRRPSQCGRAPARPKDCVIAHNESVLRPPELTGAGTILSRDELPAVFHGKYNRGGQSQEGRA